MVNRSYAGSCVLGGYDDSFPKEGIPCSKENVGKLSMSAFPCNAKKHTAVETTIKHYPSFRAVKRSVFFCLRGALPGECFPKPRGIGFLLVAFLSFPEPFQAGTPVRKYNSTWAVAKGDFVRPGDLKIARTDGGWSGMDGSCEIHVSFVTKMLPLWLFFWILEIIYCPAIYRVLTKNNL